MKAAQKISWLLCLFITVISAQTYRPLLKTAKVDTFELKLSALRSAVREKGDAASYFELAKFYWTQNSYSMRNQAFECAYDAVAKDEKNIEYR